MFYVSSCSVIYKCVFLFNPTSSWFSKRHNCRLYPNWRISGYAETLLSLGRVWWPLSHGRHTQCFMFVHCGLLSFLKCQLFL